VTFTAADLQAIADAYDPQLQQAPVVVGHPKTDAPAYAQVKRLVVNGDVLSYEEEQADEAFNDLRKKGRYKQRSASFYLPDAPGNPTPGRHYIKHVGWLGAAAPAVPGLKPVAFAGDDTGCVEFTMNADVRDRVGWAWHSLAELFRIQREEVIATDGIEKADRVYPTYQIEAFRKAGDAVSNSSGYTNPESTSTAAVIVGASNPSEEEPAVTDKNELAKQQEELEAAQKKLAADQAALKAEQQRIADSQATQRRDEATSFADGLIKEGRLLPKDKASTVELLLALPATTPLKFSEGDTTVEKTADALLRSLLSTLPKRIDFAEKSAAEHAEHSAEFAAPAGFAVNSERMDTFSKAKAYQAQHPTVSWVDAVRAVGG
jgi:hypothetical protein